MGWNPKEPLDFLEPLIEIVDHPLLVLGRDLRVERANQAFYHTFDCRPRETLGRPVGEFGGAPWDAPDLRTLLEGALQRPGTTHQIPFEPQPAGHGPRTLWCTATGGGWLFVAVSRPGPAAVYDAARRCLARELRLLADVAATCHLASEVAQPVSRVLSRLARHYGWRFAQALFPVAEDSTSLSSVFVGPSSSLGARLPLARARRDQGLPGMVFASHQPQWSTDVARELEARGIPGELAAGLKLAGAFPILSGRRVAAVLEFMTDRELQVDRHFLRRMRQVGVQLGQVMERIAAERGHRERQARLQAILETAPDAIVTIDDAGVIRSFNPAAVRLFGYRADEVLGRNAAILLPSFARPQSRNVAECLRAVSGERPGRDPEPFGRRRDGEVFPVEITVSHVAEHGLFTAIIRDVSEQRALEREVLTIFESQQRRIGQDLHDDVGQELTGLALKADALAGMVGKRSRSDRALVHDIAGAIHRVRSKVSALSRGLIPMDVAGGGLVPALEDLAARVEAVHHVTCRVRAPDAAVCPTAAVATQLYHIAQEAINNAVKHAGATQIEVTLDSRPALTLEVRDNGCGIPDVAQRGRGMGLRTMGYRAGLIGGRLQIERLPAGGTSVRCRIHGTSDQEHDDAGRIPTAGQGIDRR
jgi:two-component system CheB/CheR fusion protein